MQIVSSIYGMESVVYLTSGLTDSFENQDIDLECALVKVRILLQKSMIFSTLSKFQIFCSEKLHEISLMCLDIVGPPAASNTHWANEMNREIVRYSTLYESNGVLKVMSVLLGLQHIGVSLFIQFIFIQCILISRITIPMARY